VSHLRYTVEHDPLDREAAALLHLALTHAGDAAGAQALVQERRLLMRAAPGVVKPEPWFAEAAPSPAVPAATADGELASIIVPCHNQLEYTRLCLESVLRHTRPPYELVLVDNASTDGTPAYLRELRARPGPTRVEVVRNDQNLGFPAGCNQGLRQARGRYLILLNNDTVVTPGWLDGLVACATRGGPQAGLVGAVTNASRPPQEVRAGYADLSGLDAFAARRRQQFAGQALAVERLTGFCLLLRREALDEVGGLDEGYGLGFFDDDDLSVRARRAGFTLLVAQDVYIHHFGNRTFQALGIDARQQLKENFERFQQKWGAEESAGYRMPAEPGPVPTAVVPAAAATPRRPRTSLCMIVKDEERNLPECLSSVADLVDEVVIVDTGSADRTKEVAARFGARVFDFRWVDHFAAARNESLRHAIGEWVFWMDADDRLDEDNRRKLRALFEGLNGENAAYVMKCLCVPDAQVQDGTVVDHVRLFRNRPDVRWDYRVHEQILPAVRASGADVRWADVVVRHVGYTDPALRRRKLERDLRLLRLEDGERPNHPFVLFNLGSVSQELGDVAGALTYFGRSLERSHPADSITRKLFALIAGCQWRLGRREDALAACVEGRGFYPDDAELLFREAGFHEEAGDDAGAEACWRRLIDGREGPHFASVGAGLRGYLARHRLALLCLRRGQLDEAEAHWRAALAERPDFAEARLGLEEVSRQRGHLPAMSFSVTADLPTPSRNGGAMAGLEERYRRCCAMASDIHEHLPTLYALARECRHVTEMGTRTGVSTTALLFAQPQRLVCYDRVRHQAVDDLSRLAGRTQFVFHQADVLAVEIEETNLLFIDTWHVYEQLREELRRHGGKARRWVVLHDTTTFGESGEGPGRRGLWPAVEEFLARGEFALESRYENNNGLTVLRRIASGPPGRNGQAH
jgi:GT2 family glycosyltransferase/tetratricopeptide (TPR) repeat protein